MRDKEEMNMKYKDLDLRHLREVCDIDFAHYTYKRGQCSCCYGPKDLPSMYWRHHKVLVDVDYDDISYILFKNADNGSGIRRANDELNRTEFIEWNLTSEQLDKVIAELKRQVGDEYDVIYPESKLVCIKLVRKEEN